MTRQDIRYRRDGLIDHTYYMQRGRVMRSETAHDLFASLTSALSGRTQAKRRT